MGQELSFDDADDARTRPARGPCDPGRNQPKAERVTRRQRNLQAHVSVPMLDWPSDLYSDDATLAELMSEDWALQYDPNVPSQGRASPGICVQAAA